MHTNQPKKFHYLPSLRRAGAFLFREVRPAIVSVKNFDVENRNKRRTFLQK